MDPMPEKDEIEALKADPNADALEVVTRIAAAHGVELGAPDRLFDSAEGTWTADLGRGPEDEAAFTADDL